jgi:myo-inositol-1(or 4)-monophosphatase
VEACLRAGALILERYQGPRKPTSKGPRNPVTNADIDAEEAVLGILRREYPQFGVQAEESGAIASQSDFRWLVDPLDGTRNYVSGIPHFCTAIALVRAQEVVLAVTYDPLRREFYHAVRGEGAFLNGGPISVSGKGAISRCLIGFDMGYSNEEARRALDLVQALWPGMQSIRIMGSSALGLAYAACGRIDLYFHHRLSPWDVAGGLLLVHEARGLAVDRHGRPATPDSESVIASSPRLISRFLKATEGLAWRR